MVIKGGVIAWSQMGDPNASIPTPQPVFMRPMFGSFGKATSPISAAFVTQISVQEGDLGDYELRKQIVPVAGCRSVTKADMIWNNATPDIQVDPETYEVTADGQALTCEPAEKLPLAQKYFVF